MTLPPFEKLASFYLGREVDPATRELKDDLVLYDAKDLTTHAVCVGMTGSGKTGLCIDLLEEAAIDGIPAIAIDPKGDLGNLMLTFPDLAAPDFRPWVEPEAAARKGLTVEAYAEKTATQWREGLASWGQDGERIARFRDAVDLAIYTPGSDAGLPLSVLRSFAAPPPALADDADALRDRVQSATSGLLALLGIDADPLRSREHILVATLLDRAWREGRDLEVEDLIRGIQKPPFDRVGVLDVDSFFPSKDRFELAIALNNLLASPGFQAWMEGEPLDVQRLLYTAEGKPRLAIVSIAHLSDAERMFFVTLLLGEVVAWMRTQSGSSSLRALLYMDEVFGFLPPTANPPSKTPMLTLLKQARAFGLGVVLATQNPVDLDYKALSNAGTWLLGRLQTERDKARVLDGLEGASAASGAGFDRAATEALLSGLESRSFYLHSVHEDRPVVFRTRWALSYLRGPLTRQQIRTLMAERKGTPQAAARPRTATATAAPDGAGERPVLPPGVPETFALRRLALPPGAALVYRPHLLARVRLHYAQAKQDVDVWETVGLLTALDEEAARDPWESAQELAGGSLPTGGAGEPGARYVAPPAEALKPKQYAAWGKALAGHLVRARPLVLLSEAELGAVSRPGEAEGAFRARLAHVDRERRDREVEALRAKYGPRVERLEDRIRRAEQRVETERSQYESQRTGTWVSIGKAVLGTILGRKRFGSGTVERAGTAMRGAGRTAKQKQDIEHAQENVEALVAERKELEAELAGRVEELSAPVDPASFALTPLEIPARKSDVVIEELALAWLPTAQAIASARRS